MSRKRRKPPSMPDWYWWDQDGCWYCKNKNNCNNCPHIKSYRKFCFSPKEKGKHSANQK